jgi:hypothetical protein
MSPLEKYNMSFVYKSSFVSSLDGKGCASAGYSKNTLSLNQEDDLIHPCFEASKNYGLPLCSYFFMFSLLGLLWLYVCQLVPA